MPRKHILLVETDLQNRRLLEVSLSKAGFDIDVAASEGDALAKCGLRKPDLMISGTVLQDSSGFDLCQSIRSRDAIGDVPFIFLSEDASVGSKVKGLELGADDYLVRPIYIKDLLSRIEILMANVHRDLVSRTDVASDTMRGDLSKISLVEVIQAMAASKKDGTARLDGPNARGHIWFHQGQVIDASVNNLQGEAALFRMFRWESGHFEIDFQTPERLVAIHRPVTELVHEALNQTELWEQLTQQLPSLNTICIVNFEELAERLDELPDSHTALIRMIDGERSILDVARSSNLSDVNALNIFSQLFFEGLVNESGHRTDAITATQPGLALNTLADAFVEAVEDADGPATPQQVTQAPATEVSVPPETPVIDVTEPSVTVDITANQTESPPVEEGAEPQTEQLDETVTTEVNESQTADPDDANLTDESGESFEEERSFWDLAESTKSGTTDTHDENFGFGSEEPQEFDAMEGATVGDAGTEDEFFESSSTKSFEDDEYDFDDDVPKSSGIARKFAVAVIIVFIPLAIFIFTKDRVSPKSFSKRVLNDKWAETTVRALPTLANSVALDAGWTIPELGDAGILPAPEGSADTYKETRPKVDVDTADKETADQEAMEPVVPTKEESGTVVEAGNTASPAQKKEADALNKQGKAALDSESFQVAADLFEKSLALDPSNLAALRMNAHVMVELNRMEEAIEFGLKAIRLGAPVEDATELYQLLGQAHQSLGRTQEAKTAYENFLKLVPKSKNEETRENAQYIRQLLTTLDQEGTPNADPSN